MNQKLKSPLKDKPLRSPGQSLEKQKEALFDDKLVPAIITFTTALAFAVFEWMRYLLPKAPSPWLFTSLALVALVFLVWSWFRLLPRFRNLNRAIDGEKAVGQFLERLRVDGYDVFHDVMGKHFNVDHIIVGPAGVFTVETKTWSKPLNGDVRIRFDGEKIWKGKLEPDRDPIVQARAQARWVKALLVESCGKEFTVRPVVVFPGWFVEPPAVPVPDIWVLEPKALPGFLKQERTTMAPEDVRLAAYHLSRFIRVGERDNA